MKKGIKKRVVIFLFVAAFVFCDAGVVWAEENMNPLAEKGQAEMVTQEVPEETPDVSEHIHSYVGIITKEPTTTEKGEKTFT